MELFFYKFMLEKRKFMSSKNHFLYQETGDIFFPARWLGASLGGHNSEVAAQKVRDYISQHPDLSSNLKNKVLQASDMLHVQGRLYSA